jgi:hypothetical protein
VNEAILFASQFVTVALLVIQSQNNVHGHFWLAAGTSVLIGVAQVATFKLLPTADASELVAWIAAGPFANMFAQWVKRHDISKIRRLHK